MFLLNQQVMRRWVDPVDPDTVLITGAHGQGTHGIRAPCVVRYSSGTTYRDMIVVGWRATRDGPRPVHADPHALDRGASEVAAGLAEVIGYWRPDPWPRASGSSGCWGITATRTPAPAAPASGPGAQPPARVPGRRAARASRRSAVQ